MAFPNIFASMFGPAPSPAPVAAAPAVPATPASADVPAFQGTAQTPTDGTNPAPAPLDDYKNLFTPKAPDPANPSPQLPGIKMDVSELEKTVNGMTFAPQVTPEVAAALGLATPEATQALQGLLNSVAQQTFLRATIANSSVAEKLANQAVDYSKATLPEVMRSREVNNSLASVVPNFDHAAVRPMVEAVARQIMLDNPKASEQEVAQKTATYLQLLAGSQQQQQANQAQNMQTNWDNFFNG